MSPPGGLDLPDTLAPLLERFLAGDRVAAARAISVVENGREGFEALLHALLARGFRARRVGLTGPPGAGKSSLLTGLARTYRARGESVGIVAVDPTSPVSGGALLGDRIRMNELSTDPGIFIRSMATRGSLGGLATTTREVIDVLDAFGFERVLVETVGVGQTELEITGAADTVVVVLVPESGDAIQAMKAGLMEIADVFVVNKADRPGADRLVKEISVALHLRAGEALRHVPAHHGVELGRQRPRGRTDAAQAGSNEGPRRGGGGEERPTGGEGAYETPWEIPILKTVAHAGEGIPEVAEALDRHRTWLEASGELERRRRERAERRVRDVVLRELRGVAETAAGGGALRPELDRIEAGEATPYSVARTVLAGLLKDRDAAR